MPFRGYFTLNGVEIANSSRVVAHIGATVPTSDLGLISAAGDCSIPAIDGDHPLLGEVPASSVPIGPGRLLGTPPDGSRLYSPGLAVVGDCWTPTNLCLGCKTAIGYDDTWPELSAFLDDNTVYRPELAPWHSTRIPESAEFGGVVIFDVQGLDTTPAVREVIEMAGDGAAAGPGRDGSRKVTFDALLIACTNAGLTYGLQWLTCALRGTIDRDDSVLRYFAAHPSHSGADPASLLREVYGVVMTSPPTPSDSINASNTPNQQATMYRVKWELTITRPYSYLPAVTFPVEWDEITVDPIQWVHESQCEKPPSCAPMPALFAAGCDIETIEIVTSPPPTCGGCMPVCSIKTFVFVVPTFATPIRCRQTAVTLSVVNLADKDLTLQGYWRRCNSREVCDDNKWPVQITGLPPTAELVLDGISGRYWVNYRDFKRRPFGMVGTPSGVPWRPPLIDRELCWEFVVTAATGSDFEITMRMADREA